MSDTPARIAALPVDPQRGVPVPWFVWWDKGKPDFRVVAPGKIAEAVKFQKCWICGQPLGRNLSFTIGPMCAISRTNAEPPSHKDCAVYSALTCPFLSKPHMRRREKGMPEEGVIAGVPIMRNPGACAVWTTRTFKLFGDGRGGVLFRMGDPDEVLWFANGRAALRAEVEESIRTGLPLLEAEANGPSELAELHAMRDAVLPLLPALEALSSGAGTTKE
jgi:hypothetical protein